MSVSRSHDYLADIRRARSLTRLGLLIRAFGCHVTAYAPSSYTRDDLASMVREYDNHANLVERASSLREARRMLREWGYM
jgi:hypothetical protein